MNICILAHYFPARSETFVREHVVGLRRRGHRVLVVALAVDAAVPATELAELDAMGIERLCLGRFASPKLNRLRGLLASLGTPALRRHFIGTDHDACQGGLVALAESRAIRRWRPDVVHIHYGDHASNLLGLAGGLVDPARCIVTWHGYDINAESIVAHHGGYARLLGLPVRHSVGSQFVRRRLEALGAPPTAISVIPMGIDLDRFRYQARRYRPGETLRLFSVGRLEPVKGHDVLIAAVARLRDQGVPVTLRIAGGGRLHHTLQEQIDEAGLGDRVSLLGAVPAATVAEEMHAAHVFALTGVAESSGKVESQGVVYAEAQATGLPVIGARLGGVPESMVDGHTGRLCEPGNVASVCEAIRFFIDDPERITGFGAAGREFVARSFSIVQTIDRFEALYRDVGAEA